MDVIDYSVMQAFHSRNDVDTNYIKLQYLEHSYLFNYFSDLI